MNNRSYLVSIIIPCFNSEQTIERCINSIANQTYDNIEVLVIDDGSRDNTKSLVKKMQKEHPFVKYYFQKNSGVSCARNNGIRNASGDYVMFVDSDDYLSKNYIEDMIVHSYESDLVIAGLTFRHLDHDDITEGVLFNCEYKEFLEKYYKQSVKTRTIFGPVNKLYRRCILNSEDVLFDEHISIREDGLFVLDFLEHCKKISGIKNAGYYYIQSPTGSSLVSKFNRNELELDNIFYSRLRKPLLQYGLMDKEATSIIDFIYLNMVITSIYKLYCSNAYSFSNAKRYVEKVYSDKTFLSARKEFHNINAHKSLKYYRPFLIVHAINSLKKVLIKT